MFMVRETKLFEHSVPVVHSLRLRPSSTALPFHHYHRKFFSATSSSVEKGKARPGNNVSPNQEGGMMKRLRRFSAKKQQACRNMDALSCIRPVCRHRHPPVFVARKHVGPDQIYALKAESLAYGRRSILSGSCLAVKY
jgi:hypothetical protein